MRALVLTALLTACGASQHAKSGPAACTLQGDWTITISNAADPCGMSAPGTAATLSFHTNATGAVGGAQPQLRGMSIAASGVDCRYTLHADKSKGAAEWAEFSLEVHDGAVSGEGHTDVAMADGRVCTVPHTVTGKKE